MEGDNPVTAGDVVGWFEKSGVKSRPLPTEQHVKEIVDFVNSIRTLSTLPILRNSDLVRQAFLRMLEARSPLAKARESIAASVAICDSIDDPKAPTLLWEARQLLCALDTFLKRHPPRGSGRAEGKPWTILVRSYADKVAETLIRSGWPSASVSNDSGAVTYVTSRILEASGWGTVKPETIGRYLRSPEGRAMSGEKRKRVIAAWAITPSGLPRGARRKS